MVIMLGFVMVIVVVIIMMFVIVCRMFVMMGIVMPIRGMIFLGVRVMPMIVVTMLLMFMRIMPLRIMTMCVCSMCVVTVRVVFVRIMSVFLMLMTRMGMVVVPMILAMMPVVVMICGVVFLGLVRIVMCCVMAMRIFVMMCIFGLIFMRFLRLGLGSWRLADTPLRQPRLNGRNAVFWQKPGQQPVDQRCQRHHAHRFAVARNDHGILPAACRHDRKRIFHRCAFGNGVGGKLKRRGLCHARIESLAVGR